MDDFENKWEPFDANNALLAIRESREETSNDSIAKVAKTANKLIKNRPFSPVTIKSFDDQLAIGRWKDRVSQRVRKFTADKDSTPFSLNELDTYCGLIEEATIVEYDNLECTVGRSPFEGNFNITGNKRSDEPRRLTEGLPALIEHYDYKLLDFLRIFMITPYNIDHYIYFLDYHHHSLLQGKIASNKPYKKWSDQRIENTALKNLELGLVERADNPPPEYFLPYFTGQIEDLLKLRKLA